jgi:hypothetical protein
MRGLSVVAVFAWALAGAAGRLNMGEELPMVAGVTLYGDQLELPGADAGKPRFLVFSFSKTAGADSRLWSKRIAEDLGSGGAASNYRIIVLDSVPKLFRGMAVSGIKSGIPQALWDTTMLLYKDGAQWKERLGVTGDGYSYVVLLDGAGRVRWMGAGPFSDSKYREVKEALSKVGNGH